jgi:purine nucleosidase
MSTRKIIIDTDPGQDDAVAILLALASPELEVLGITAVAGNVPLALTQKNARIICELAGRVDIPVYAGCDAPLSRALVTAEHVHGKTGLDGPQLPDPVMPLQDGHAVDFLIRTLRAQEAGTVTLCPLGPLTNIAMAFQKAPDIVKRVQDIVLMGGPILRLATSRQRRNSTCTSTRKQLISCLNQAHQLRLYRWT